MGIHSRAAARLPARGRHPRRRGARGHHLGSGQGGLAHRQRASGELHPRGLHHGGADRGRHVYRPHARPAAQLLRARHADAPLPDTHARRADSGAGAGDVPRHSPPPGAPRGEGPHGVGEAVLRHALAPAGDDGHADDGQCAQALSPALELLHRHRARLARGDIPQHRQLCPGKQVRRRHGHVLRQGEGRRQHDKRIQGCGRRCDTVDKTGQRHRGGRRSARCQTGGCGRLSRRLAQGPPRVSLPAHQQRRRPHEGPRRIPRRLLSRPVLALGIGGHRSRMAHVLPPRDRDAQGIRPRGLLG